MGAFFRSSSQKTAQATMMHTLTLQPSDPADSACFHDATSAPFSLEGLAWFQENGRRLYRLPPNLSEPAVNSNALLRAQHTAGVSVRFRSDSTEVYLRARLTHWTDPGHLALPARNGFDTYRRLPGDLLRHNHTVTPAYGAPEIRCLCGRNPEGLLCDWQVNLPLYGGVEALEIGLKEGSVLLPPAPHAVPAPILFYGSSITQGNSASRSGNTYTAMLCRALDAEQINLGLGGSCKGEPDIARAIARLTLSAFVFDYDHNAPDPEYLEATHEPFFRIVRDAQPDLPILLLSMGDIRTYFIHTGRPTAAAQREVIQRTYQHALDRGDRNVHFIDGESFFGDDDYDACTVDGCHPNDLGFHRMYRRILPVLRQALRRPAADS